MGKAHGPKTVRDLAPDSLHLGVTDLISVEYLKMMSVHFQLCYPHQRSPGGGRCSVSGPVLE